MADEEYEYEAASPEEKLRIASHFILKSPAGEIDQVVDDVKTLVNDDSILSESILERLARQYNTDQYVFGTISSGENFPVTKWGLVDGNTYYDPKTKKSYEFDHIKRTWSEDAKSSEESKTVATDMRDAVDKAFGKYVGDLYVNKEENAYAVYATDESNLVVVVSCKRANLRSYWTGGWKGTYELTVSGDKLNVKASVQVNIHYFEAGNVQMNADFNKELDPISFKDNENAAKQFAKAVQELETGFQRKMEEMYVNMHSESFKAMRRFLPLNKQKFEWNSAAHKIAGELAK